MPKCRTKTIEVPPSTTVWTAAASVTELL